MDALPSTADLLMRGYTYLAPNKKNQAGQLSQPGSYHNETGISRQDDTAGFFPVNRYAYQRSFGDCSKVVGFLMFRFVVFCNDLQRFPKLKYCGELVLAWIGAEAGTGQIPNFTVPVIKFQLIGLGAFHDRMTFCAVKTDIPHTVFCVIVMTALCNIMADLHGGKIVQVEAGIIITGSIEGILLVRGLEPENDLVIRQYCGIEGYEMRSGKAEFPP